MFVALKSKKLFLSLEHCVLYLEKIESDMAEHFAQGDLSCKFSDSVTIFPILLRLILQSKSVGVS